MHADGAYLVGIAFWIFVGAVAIAVLLMPWLLVYRNGLRRLR
jgi:hypothetical protein